MSTSLHTINGDRRLHKLKKVQWLLFNLLSNLYFPNESSGFNIRRFCHDLKKADWEYIPDKCSPSRALSDLFWLKLDWEAIQSELGKVRILDTGCGKGDYALKLMDFSGGRVSSYCGVDVLSKDNWETMMQQYPAVTLKVQNYTNILEAIPRETNLFITQSALEHFDYDLLYFEQIRQFIRVTSGNTVQIHLFPSGACLKLYPFHGVRQYTPRTISKITKLFDTGNFYSILFSLGGSACNELHYRFIRRPRWVEKRDWRDTKTEEYRKLLEEAVVQDMRDQKKMSPSFYALVMHSNYNQRIFEGMESLTQQ